MLRDFPARISALRTSRRHLQSLVLALLAATLTSACGIKGPLKPPPAAPAGTTPLTAPIGAVPAPNAPAPGQEPPPPIEPRVVPKP